MRYAAGWSFFLLSPCKMYVWLLSKKTENRIFKGRTKVESAKEQQMEKLSKINKVKMTPTNVCEQ